MDSVITSYSIHYTKLYEAARDIIGKDNLPIDNLPYEDLDLKTFKEIENGKTENF